MKLNEFGDKLFNILNETEKLPIVDIETFDKDKIIMIRLADGSQFRVHCEDYGKWSLVKI